MDAPAIWAPSPLDDLDPSLTSFGLPFHMTLGRLPTELLLEVASKLPAAQLAKLAPVCRALRSVAEHTLYTRPIHIETAGQASWFDVTLFRRPVLAQKVTQLGFTIMAGRIEAKIPTSLVMPDPGPNMLYLPVLYDASFLGAVILNRLPRLEFLSLSAEKELYQDDYMHPTLCTYRGCDNPVKCLFGAHGNDRKLDLSLTKALANIKCLHLTGVEPSVSLCKLPSLRKLSVSYYEDIRHPEETEAITEDLPQVSELRLHCEMRIFHMMNTSRGVLKSLLPHLVSLKHAEILIRVKGCVAEDYSPIPGLLLGGLATLETLDVDHQYLAANYEDHGGFCPIGSLVNFRCLKILRIPCLVLMGDPYYESYRPIREILLASLEELHIRYVPVHIDYLLEDLDRSTEAIPRLHLVHVDGRQLVDPTIFNSLPIWESTYCFTVTGRLFR